MKFLKQIIKYLKISIKKIYEVVDEALAQATVNVPGKDGTELTSPLIEIAVRRAVSSAVVVVGAALLSVIPKESHVSSPVYDIFNRLSWETLQGGTP